jgi:hypothetical protein
MKYLLIVVISISMLKACSQEPNEQDLKTLTYTASTRGYYFKVLVDSTTVYVLTDREGNNMRKALLKPEDWQELNKLLKTVSLKELDKLMAPSEGRVVDRAAIASLKVKLSDEEYESLPFDHGNPPIEIKALIDKILQLSESVERQ